MSAVWTRHPLTPQEISDLVAFIKEGAVAQRPPGQAARLVVLAIIGVIVSEFVASQEGIGYLIKLAGGLLDTPLMMAAIAVLSISGLALYMLIAGAESLAIYWQPPAEAGGIAGG